MNVGEMTVEQWCCVLQRALYTSADSNIEQCIVMLLCVQGALYIGADINVDQCIAAVDNILFAEEIHAVHIINADVTGEFQVQSRLFNSVSFCSIVIFC